MPCGERQLSPSGDGNGEQPEQMRRRSREPSGYPCSFFAAIRFPIRGDQQDPGGARSRREPDGGEVVWHTQGATRGSIGSANVSEAEFPGERIEQL